MLIAERVLTLHFRLADCHAVRGTTLRHGKASKFVFMVI